MNLLRIKGRIVEMGMTQIEFAKQMGIAQATLSQKIKGDRPITLEQAEKMANLLNIQNDKFTYYFFNENTA